MDDNLGNDLTPTRTSEPSAEDVPTKESESSQLEQTVTPRLHQCPNPWRPGIKIAIVNQENHCKKEVYHRNFVAILNRISNTHLCKLVALSVRIIVSGENPMLWCGVDGVWTEGDQGGVVNTLLVESISEPKRIYKHTGRRLSNKASVDDDLNLAYSKDSEDTVMENLQCSSKSKNVEKNSRITRSDRAVGPNARMEEPSEAKLDDKNGRIHDIEPSNKMECSQNSSEYLGESELTSEKLAVQQGKSFDIVRARKDLIIMQLERALDEELYVCQHAQFLSELNRGVFAAEYPDIRREASVACIVREQYLALLDRLLFSLRQHHTGLELLSERQEVATRRHCATAFRLGAALHNRALLPLATVWQLLASVRRPLDRPWLASLHPLHMELLAAFVRGFGRVLSGDAPRFTAITALCLHHTPSLATRCRVLVENALEGVRRLKALPREGRTG